MPYAVLMNIIFFFYVIVKFIYINQMRIDIKSKINKLEERIDLSLKTIR